MDVTTDQCWFERWFVHQKEWAGLASIAGLASTPDPYSIATVREALCCNSNQYNALKTSSRSKNSGEMRFSQVQCSAGKM